MDFCKKADPTHDHEEPVLPPGPLPSCTQEQHNPVRDPLIPTIDPPAGDRSEGTMGDQGTPWGPQGSRNTSEYMKILKIYQTYIKRYRYIPKITKETHFH